MGIRSYSVQDNNGLFTAENESRIVLSQLTHRFKQDDIDMMIFDGDFFHTNHPTSSNIEFTIKWLIEINEINKPFFIMPGNHDDSIFSHSLAFIRSLNLPNIHLVDKASINQYENIMWKEWHLVFAPYSSNYNLKEKDLYVTTDVLHKLETSKEKTLIFTHIQEVAAKIGSESIMIAKGVDLIDIDLYSIPNDVYVISGHMHKRQMYKRGKATVCYPGNCFYQDFSDVNDDKGYMLFKEDGEILFENFTGIRIFRNYIIPQDITPFDFFKKYRIPPNELIFVTVLTDEKYDEEVLSDYIEKHGSAFGGVRYKKNEEDASSYIFSNTTDPFQTFTTWLNENKSQIIEEIQIPKEIIEDCFTSCKTIGIEIIEKSLENKEEYI